MKQKSILEIGKESSVAELVSLFLEYLKVERNASVHTLTNYEIDLRHWMRFFATRGKLKLGSICDLKEIRAFLSAEGKKYSRVTVCRRLSVFKSFLRFLYREGYIQGNIAKLISFRRVPDPLPAVLKVEEVVQLIEGIPVSNLRYKRIRSMVELFYSTGIRLSELVGLNHEDVDFRAGTIRVRGKGRKERLLPLGRHCQKAIRDYIESMPGFQKYGGKTPLFLNQEGERISGRTVQRNIREFAVEVLGDKGIKVSPHTLRHSCASHLMSAGAGLREIQELLGHRTLVTTQKYTHVDIKRLKSSYLRSHPRGSRSRKKEVSS